MEGVRIPGVPGLTRSGLSMLLCLILPAALGAGGPLSLQKLREVKPLAWGHTVGQQQTWGWNHISLDAKPVSVPPHRLRGCRHFQNSQAQAGLWHRRRVPLSPQWGRAASQHWAAHSPLGCPRSALHNKTAEHP